MSRRLNTTLREVTHVVHIDMSILEIMEESEVEMSTVENLEEREVEMKVQAGQLAGLTGIMGDGNGKIHQTGVIAPLAVGTISLHRP